MKKMLPIALMGYLLLTGCSFAVSSLPASNPTQTPAQAATALPPSAEVPTSIFTLTSLPPTPTLESFTAIPSLPTLTLTSPPASSDICTDPQVTPLINSLKTSMQTSDGALLGSLVSPPRGLDVAFFRGGSVINYRPDQARFLFETTFEVDWGAAPGSGAEKIGSFHEVVVPELVKAFNQQYTLYCKELKHGSASYEVSWPYQGDFYSIYYPGTEANGFMDWHTWVVGIEYVNSKPYLYALIPFIWEP